MPWPVSRLPSPPRPPCWAWAALNCQKAVQDYNASLDEVNRRIANKP